MVNADGTGRRNLTRTEDVSESVPRWSPDGELIVYASAAYGVGSIAVMEGDGTGRRLLVQGEWPDWSSDGQRIVYTSVEGSEHQQVWVMDSDGSNQRRVTGDDTLASFEAAWSPDGSRIAFSTSRHGNPSAADPALWNEEVHLMDPDGSGSRRVTNRLGNDHWPPAWSPDSTRLLVTSDGVDKAHPQGFGEIFVVDLGTLDSIRLTQDPADDSFPAWRPVGR